MSSHPNVPVTVHLGERVSNLDQAQKVVANVLGRLGCGSCFSGFDIRFAQSIDLAVNPRTLEVREFAD